MTPIKLSDGTTILPAGTTISMAAESMAHDPVYYDDPLRFNGFRFWSSKSRDKAAQPEKEYTGIEPGNLSWGNGRFTCPGRWYASVLMKLFVANLLLEYDFEFPKGQTSRPSNIQRDVDIRPDFDQMIIVKERLVSA